MVSPLSHPLPHRIVATAPHPTLGHIRPHSYPQTGARSSGLPFFAGASTRHSNFAGINLLPLGRRSPLTRLGLVDDVYSSRHLNICPGSGLVGLSLVGVQLTASHSISIAQPTPRLQAFRHPSELPVSSIESWERFLASQPCCYSLRSRCDKVLYF